MKKIINFFLVFSVLTISLTTLLVYVGAEEYNDYHYSVYNNEATLLSYNGYDSNIVLPSVIKGKKVTSVLLSDSKFVESISVPEGVVEISISNYPSLKKISLPKSLKRIRSFQLCYSLESIVIPNNVTEIDDWAFRECTSLSSVKIGSNVKRIGSGAFENCRSLKTIKIPNNVTEIGYSAFSKCDKLKSITLSSKITEISGDTFGCCSNLTSIDIPKSVKSIGGNAFAECTSLKTVTLHKGLKVIEDGAFQNCLALKKIKIPSSVSYIGYYSLGYVYKNNDYNNAMSINNNFIIYGTSNSKANKYAKEKKITFISIPDDITEFQKNISDNSAKLTWKTDNDAKGYIIQKYSNKKWEEVTNITNKDTNTYTIKNLSSKTTYTYRIMAYKKQGATIITGTAMKFTITTK